MNKTRQVNKYDFTNIILDDDFKKFVLKTISYAQDDKNNFYLSRMSSYKLYHDELKKYFKEKKYNKTPTQTDNLTFLLILTYPERIISSFTSVKDIKLAFNNPIEESDFHANGFQIDETGDSNSCCICNEPLKYIHNFINKYTGISFQIGSVCNERYGLINKNDTNYKSTCKKIKEYKEKQAEKKEGKPEGFYENERKQKKIINSEKIIIKQENELMKKEDKLIKSIEKINKKELNKFGFNYVNKKCYFCKTDGIYIKQKLLCICSKCCSNEQKEIKIKTNKLILKYGIDLDIIRDCYYCEKEFVTINDKKMCNDCIKIVKINNCLMCNEIFCVGIKITDNYCEDCEDKIIKCINCTTTIYKHISKNQFGRCNICFYRFVNKLTVILCKYCEEKFEVSEKENWRTCCTNCFKDNVALHKCQFCDDMFKKLPHETWKKSCSNCYYKFKNKD
jgi:hypothetical protein